MIRFVLDTVSMLLGLIMDILKAILVGAVVIALVLFGIWVLGAVVHHFCIHPQGAAILLGLYICFLVGITIGG